MSPGFTVSVTTAPPSYHRCKVCFERFPPRAWADSTGSVPQRVSADAPPGVPDEHLGGYPFLQELVSHRAVYKAAGIHPCYVPRVAMTPPRL